MGDGVGWDGMGSCCFRFLDLYLKVEFLFFTFSWDNNVPSSSRPHFSHCHCMYERTFDVDVASSREMQGPSGTSFQAHPCLIQPEEPRAGALLALL